MRREIHLGRFPQSRQIMFPMRAGLAHLKTRLRWLSEMFAGDWNGLVSRRELAEFGAQHRRSLQR